MKEKQTNIQWCTVCSHGNTNSPLIGVSPSNYVICKMRESLFLNTQNGCLDGRVVKVGDF